MPYPYQHINPPELFRQTAWRDRYETKVCNWINPWDGQEKYDIGLIGIPLSKSSISPSGASTTPNAIRDVWRTMTTYNADYDVDLKTLVARDIGDVKMHVTDIKQCHLNIEQGLSEWYSDQPKAIPIIIGGDHSITCPSVKAFVKHHPGRIGMIHFDSHLDVRNLEDGGPSNGTPIRGLLETNTIKGEDIYTIGIHGFMNSREYRDYAEEQGIHIYTAREVRKRTIEVVLAEVMNELESKVDHIYVTVDIDVLDHVYAPGSPGSGPGGMTTPELFDSLFEIGKNKRVKAMDLVCIDPLQDVKTLTVKSGAYTILSFLCGYMLRSSQ